MVDEFFSLVPFYRKTSFVRSITCSRENRKKTRLFIVAHSKIIPIWMFCGLICTNWEQLNIRHKQNTQEWIAHTWFHHHFFHHHCHSFIYYGTSALAHFSELFPYLKLDFLMAFFCLIRDFDHSWYQGSDIIFWLKSSSSFWI